MLHYLIATALVLTACLGAVQVRAQDGGDAARGLLYARSTCARCHGVEADDTTSPVSAAPRFSTIAAMPSMTGTAITVWLQSPHPSMPMLIVPDAERDHLIAYILSLKTKR